MQENKWQKIGQGLMAVVLLAIISLVTALSWGLNRGGERG